MFNMQSFFISQFLNIQSNSFFGALWVWIFSVIALFVSVHSIPENVITEHYQQEWEITTTCI